MKQLVRDILRHTGYEIRVQRAPEIPARRVAFIHIPKCAGMAVDAAIRCKIGRPEEPRVDGAAARRAARLLIGGNDPVRFADGTPAYRRFLLAYHLCRGGTFVSGHLPVDTALLEAFRTQVAFVTVLRHPVERWKSHYLFDKLHNRDLVLQPCRNSSLGIEDELRGVLDSPQGWHLATVPTMILAGRFPKDREEALGLAKDVHRNLALFAVVGFTDSLDRFESDFYRAVGVQIKIGRENETRAGLDPADEPLHRTLKELLNRPDIDAAITRLCSMEIETYQLARQKFMSDTSEIHTQRSP
jgi:hypothetical protein